MSRVSVAVTKSLAGQYKGDMEGASGYKVEFFSDPPRADPSDASGAAVKLVTLTDDAQVGIGGTFEVPIEGKLIKATSLILRGTNVATDIPTWACLCEVGDDLSAASATAFRHDFTVGTYEDAPLPDIRRETALITINNETKLNKVILLFPESVSDL
jgi:hypothetical protein